MNLYHDIVNHFSILSKMKKHAKFILWAALLSVLALSCTSNSNEDQLKAATKKLNNLTEAISSAKNVNDFDRSVDSYNKLVSSLPQEIQDMSESDLASLTGGKEYLEAMSDFEEAYYSGYAKFISNAVDQVKDITSSFGNLYQELTSGLDDDYDDEDE